MNIQELKTLRLEKLQKLNDNLSPSDLEKIKYLIYSLEESIKNHNTSLKLLDYLSKYQIVRSERKSNRLFIVIDNKITDDDLKNKNISKVFNRRISFLSKRDIYHGRIESDNIYISIPIEIINDVVILFNFITKNKLTNKAYENN